MKRTTAMAFSGLVLAGCSGATDAAKPPATSSTMKAPASSTPAPVVAQSYSTVVELKDAAIAAGLPCPRWRQTNVVTLAAESGTCSSDSVLSTYATSAALQRSLDAFLSFPIKSVILVGPNWIINAEQAPTLAAAMGGTVNHSK